MASLKTTRDINLQLARITVFESDVESTEKILIGNGSYGAVFKVKYCGKPCAAKEIHSILFEETEEKLKLLDVFSRECCQCSELNHHNIVKFIGIYFPHNQLLPVMLMELMDDSLRVYLEKKLPTQVTLTMKNSILIDVAEGLSYLHHSNPSVVHRDLTPNNILLKLPCDEDSVPVAKISDLGVAKAVEANKKIKQRLTKLPGTPGFMPPEAFEENPVYNTSLDIFSYGGVALFVANQIWPDPSAPNRFDDNTKQLIALTEVQRRQKYLDKMKDGVEIWRPMVESCLSNNQGERPTIVEVSEKLKSFKLTELQARMKQLATRLQQEAKLYSNDEIEHQFEVIWKKWMDSFTTNSGQVIKYPSDYEIEEEIVNVLREYSQINDYLLVSKLLAKPLNERSCELQFLVNKDVHLKSTRWLSFGLLGNDIELAKKLTKECLCTTRECLNTIKMELKPFTSNFACEILKDLFKSIDGVMKSEKKIGFNFTPEYKIDVALMMCACVSDVFKWTTRKLQDNDPTVKLNKIKVIFLNMFKDLCKDVNKSKSTTEVSDVIKQKIMADRPDTTNMFIIIPLIVVIMAVAVYIVLH